MNETTAPYTYGRELRVFGLTGEQFRLGLLWLLFATSFFVIVEPAPSEFLFVILFLVSLFGGLKLHPLISPLVLLLILYNIGCVISLQQPLFEPSKARFFVVISIYMAFTAMFIAGLIAQRPLERLDIINKGWVFGGTLGSILALMGFFNVFGLAETFTLYGRATGSFKDPNVYSTYIIYPMVVCLHWLLTKQTRRPLLTFIAFVIMFAGLFLAFSRGAYGVFLAAALLTTLLVFMQTNDPRLRARIVFLSACAIVAVVILLLVLLSIEPIRNLFLIRFSANQSYDVGETGRFARQLKSIPILLKEPLGFGPLQFSRRFGEDPHNTFINAFSSYSWLGGVSYITLIGITLWVMFRTVATSSYVRAAAIPAFATLLFTILQGLQIDTDHWRHLYWLLGIVWGLFIAKETAPRPGGA